MKVVDLLKPADWPDIDDTQPEPGTVEEAVAVLLARESAARVPAGLPHATASRFTSRASCGAS